MKDAVILKKTFSFVAPFIQNWDKHNLHKAETNLSHAREGYMTIPPTPWSINPLTRLVGDDYVEYLEEKCEKLQSRIKRREAEYKL